MSSTNFDVRYSLAAFNRREEQWSHVSYKAELALLEAVKRGEVDKIPIGLNDVFPTRTSHLSNNPRMQAIYEFIACVTLVTRFAVEGGASAEQAYTLSDTFIKTADETTDSNGVYALYRKMLVDFTTMVKRAKSAGKTFSLPIINAMKYIDSNLHYKITLTDIANEVDRNPAYLCTHFKEETGIPLSQYINRERVTEAKHLLRDTNMTIAEIATALAFGSQSYFTKVFSEVTGETPKDFRRKQVFVHTV